MLKHPKFIFLVLFGLILGESFAQDFVEEERVFRDRPDYKRGLQIYLIIPAYTISSFANINQNLSQNNYPILPRGHLNYGFGFNYRLNRFLMGADVFWGNQVNSIEIPALAMSRRNPLTYSYNFAYHVYKRDGFAIYPQVGFNFTDTNLFLSKTTATAPTLNGILAAPGNSISLFHPSAGLFVGIGFDAHWLFRKESLTTSLKIGYRIQVEESSAWKSFYTPITNAPTDNFNYWSVQLGLGGVFNWDKKSDR